MSAVPRGDTPGRHAVRVRPMDSLHADAVAAIEATAYAFPWSRGNFIDSLAAGYLAEVLLDEGGRVVGYFVAMSVVDELHLLNITIAPVHQGRGHALRLLDRLMRHARARGAVSVWLEVRESNVRARAIYERYGFRVLGRRPGYYPAPNGREDALLMSIAVAAAPGGDDGVD
jgi:ribosomal-protein-alanine N-acetyltransferase